MTTTAPGRWQWTTAGMSEVLVAQVVTAVHTAMACFVLVAVINRHVDEGLGVRAQVAVAAAFLTVAVLLTERPRRGDRP